jgi:methionyl-tRNA formyltransferase
LPEGHLNDEIIEYCNEQGLKYLFRKKSVPVAVKRLDYEMLISSSFQFLINREEYEHLRFGGINIHASILPTYKGKHSDVWALINGETTLGITVHRLNERFDDGEILNIYRTDIDDTLKNTEIYEKVFALLPEIVHDICTLRVFHERNITKGKDIYWRTRTTADSRIDWSKSARKIFLYVRALSRNPIYAYSYQGKTKTTFIAVSEASMTSTDYPGTLISYENSWYVVCGDHKCVKVEEVVEKDIALIAGAVLQ